MARFRQKALFCLDCGGLPAIAGLCLPCYARRQNSIRHFAGSRDEVLARDGHRCRGCGSAGRAGKRPPVHHRRPGIDQVQWLITVCPSCHALIHKLLSHRRFLPSLLLELWREQHPAVPLQGQLAIGEDLTAASLRGREAGRAR